MARVAMALAATDLGRSGLGRWVIEVLPRLRRALLERGHSLVVLATEAERAAYASILAETPVVLLPSVLDRAASSALFSLAAVGLAAQRAGADVLLLPSANRRAPLWSPIPTIAVVHDLATARSAARHGRARQWFVRHGILRALRAATALVAVSESTAAELGELLSERAPPITVARNGVDAQRFAPRSHDDPSVQHARAQLSLAGPYVLYPSRLEAPAKNHHRLIEAFAQSRARETHTLVLVGPDWGAERSLRALVDSLGLGERVRFAGAVDDRTLEGLVCGASLVTVMGMAEGFGLPVLEAFAAGRAVLASRAGALPEVVGDLGVLVDPCSVPRIRDELDRCVSDPTIAARAASLGPSYVRGFSWDAVASTLRSLCEQHARAHVQERGARLACDDT